MENSLQETGWSLDTHKLPAAILEELLKKKNEFLKISFEEVEKSFHVSLSEFDNEKIEYIELAKGITRSLLRYDDCSYLLAQCVWKELKETYNLRSEINYLTLPYPIIHLPSDTSEVGPKHKDGYDYIDHFYTTWTPLNDCFHKPLSITEKTHRKNGFVLRQLRARISVIDRLILSMKKTLFPDIRKGEFFVWHGTTDHEGLLNRADFIATALVIRFTSSPIHYEVSLSCTDLEKFVPGNAVQNITEIAKKFILLFNKVNSHAKENDVKRASFSELSKKIDEEINSWKLSSNEAKRFSFLLALWAQRMDGKRNVSLFYLYSYFVARDNFYVFHKCITNVLRDYKQEQSKKFIVSSLEKTPCTQMKYVIGSAINLNKDKFSGFLPDFPPDLKLLKHKFE